MNKSIAFVIITLQCLLPMLLFGETSTGPTRSVPKTSTTATGHFGGYMPNSSFHNSNMNTHMSNSGWGGFNNSFIPISQISRDPFTGRCSISSIITNIELLRKLYYCLECESFEFTDSVTTNEYGTFESADSVTTNDSSKESRNEYPWLSLFQRDLNFYRFYLFTPMVRRPVFFDIYKGSKYLDMVFPSNRQWQSGILSVEKFRYSIVLNGNFARYLGSGISGAGFALENQFYLRLSDHAGIREAIVLERLSDRHPTNDFERDVFENGSSIGIQKDITGIFTNSIVAFLTEFVLCSPPRMGSPFFCFIGGGACYLEESMDCTRKNSWENTPDQLITVHDNQWLGMISGGFGGTLLQIKRINLGFEARFTVIINDYSRNKSSATDNSRLAGGASIGPRIQF